MALKKIKFCDYIQSIKKDFEKYNTFLFVRFIEKDIHLIKSIRGKSIITFEISEDCWEEVEWEIEDEEIIYLVSVFEIIRLLKKQNIIKLFKTL